MPTSELNSLENFEILIDIRFFFPLILRVLLRVRMLYYIKHEVLGDLVTQIHEGANARYLAPFRGGSLYLSVIIFLLIVTSISQIHSFIFVRAVPLPLCHVLIVFDSVLRV